MAKNNLLQDFTTYSISNEECSTVKGGRANNPINTGSYGFIVWDDLEIRNQGAVVRTLTSATVAGIKTQG